MKRQVTQEAIESLIHLMYSDDEYKREILKAIKTVLPMLSDGKEKEAVELVAKFMTGKYAYLRKEDEMDFLIGIIFRCIHELDYYTDKETVIDATIDQLTDTITCIEKKERTLKKNLPEIKAWLDQCTYREKLTAVLTWQLINKEHLFDKPDNHIGNEVFSQFEDEITNYNTNCGEDASITRLVAMMIPWEV